MKRRVLIFLLFSFMLLAFDRISDAAECGQFPAEGFDAADMAVFKGHYRNANYLYAVTIPKGLVGHDAPPPAPQHGFGVVLAWQPRSYIWFDSSANVLDYNSADAALRAHVKYVREDAGTVLSTRISTSSLGKADAKKLEVHYRCSKSSQEKVDIVVISLRSARSLVDTAG